VEIAVRKKDIERLAAIALSANAGDEALACKMAERLWRCKRWTTEQMWRVEAAKDAARRQLLERVSTSVDGALQALAGLQALEDAGPTAAPEAAATVAEPAAPAAADEPAQETDRRGDGTTAEQIKLVTSVLKSGVKA